MAESSPRMTAPDDTRVGNQDQCITRRRVCAGSERGERRQVSGGAATLLLTSDAVLWALQPGPMGTWI